MAKLGTSPLDARRVASALVRYRKDFRAFAREQLKIKGQPFQLWPCQEPLLQSIEQQMNTQGFVRSVFLKARQVGCSTLVEALVAWRTMLWPNINAVVIADVAPRSATLFDIAKAFYESMDEDIRPVGRYVTKRELVFANPSRLTGFKDPGLRSRIMIDSAAKRNIAIGARWDLVHLSEVARFPDPSFVIDGVIPAVHRVPDTMLIMESSAEKSGRWFRDFCESSMRGETGFDFKFVPWFLQPEYYICPVCKQVFPDLCQDPMHELEAEKYMRLEGEERHIMVEFGLGYGHILWMRMKLAEMGNDWDLFRQSFPLTVDDAWVQSGIQAFPMKVLRELKGQICPPVRIGEVLPGPIMADIPSGRLKVWEEPKVGKAYDIGVDVSQGVGRDDAVELLEPDSPVDWSVACVLERGSNKQVAEWASRAMDPVQLATTLYWLGKYYLDAQVAVETNGIGGITNQQLAKLGYYNCLTPDHKVLTADLRWVAVGDLREGDSLIGFDEKAPIPRRLRRYHRADVIGHEIRKENVYRIVLSDGSELRATGEHPWIVVKHKSHQDWIMTSDLRVGDVFPKGFTPWATLRSFDAGWMSGILDGEGSAGYYPSQHDRGGRQVAIAQNPGSALDRICEVLQEWGITYCLTESAGKLTKYILIGRKDEVARLLGMVRPLRLLPKVCPEWFGTTRAVSHATVEAVEKIGKKEIVALGTTTGTYVAEGYLSKNSYIWRYRDEVVPRYSKKTGWECVTPSAKILTSDLRWMDAQDLIVGSRIVGCKEQASAGKGGSYHLGIQTVVAKRVFTAPLIEVRLSNGQQTIVSSTHPFLAFRKSFGKLRWIQATDLCMGDVVKYIPMWNEPLRTYDAGRLSAFLDGEGHLSHAGPTGLHMLISQAEGPLAQEINELWSELGFDWTFKWLRHKKRPHEKPIATSGLIRLTEVFRALGLLRPTRLLRVFFDHIDISRNTTRSFQSVPVESVKRVGEGIVLGLTTDPDHTLIVDGIVGHNTNSKSKPWLIGFATHELMNGRVQIRSERLLKEMETYVRKDINEWGAVAGRHDDALVAFMIALLVSDDENFERYFGLRKTVEKGVVGTQTPDRPRIPESYECDRDFKTKMQEKIDTPWE